MLQYIATKIGVTVLLTPKCHAELAGEGIEYMWACSKSTYQNLSLKGKKGKENVNASVRHCLSVQIDTVRRIRKFARCACQYLINGLPCL
jgi:glutamine synthetase type III